MHKVRLLLDGERVKTRRELPAWARGKVRRRARALRRDYRIRANGAVLALFGAGFTPVISTRTASGTETVPSGASTVIMEAWGETGSGGAGSGSGCTASGGGGGGSGGYSRTSFSVVTKGGLTWTVTIGSGATGTATSIVAGTMTGWATMTAGFGGSGGTGPLGTAGAAGAIGTGGTQANTAGNAGATGLAGSGGTGGAGVVGVNGTGSAGGHGGEGASNIGRTLGTTGKMIASYT